MKDIVYFEFNNWTCGEDYPADQPYISWLGDDLDIKFNDEKWVKENNLCVIKTIVDMSLNFCITATREWVEENCPSLLTEYKEFLRFPDEDNEVHSEMIYVIKFLEYTDYNIGITNVDW